MGKLILDMSVSVDGFGGWDNGDDGLHAWVFGGSVPVEAAGMTFQLASEASAKVFRDFVDAAGAFIAGRSAFAGTNDSPIFQKPTFVLTHTAREPLHKQGTTITFVTDGIESALKQARAAAGDKNVCIFGGIHVAQEYLKAGLVDEVHVNVVDKLLGIGMRLFGEDGGEPLTLECIQVVPSKGVTHIQYKVVK